MGASLNKVILIGRLCADPECRSTQTGKKVVSFRLAVDRRSRDAQADFIPVTAWDKLAEICEKYLVKGKQVAIEGRLQTRIYEVDGQKRSAFDVVADNMVMIGSRNDNEAYQGGGSNQYQPASQPSGGFDDNYGDVEAMQDVPF